MVNTTKSVKSRLKQQVAQHFQAYADATDRIVLAFSGGLDSCVLLDILRSVSSTHKLLVWHVNHGLQDCAGDMENFCKRRSTDYQVDFRVSHLKLSDASANLEALARKGRYAEFEKHLTPADLLLTAHHADDQSETLLMNLLRGSGSAGLRGIAENRRLGKAWVLRPLLPVSRDTLAEYARQRSITWFEDPSNQNERFDRNYLRRQVLPALKARWPGYLDSIRRVCRIQSETQQLMDEIGEADYQYCRLEPLRLCQQCLDNLSIVRQKNVIRFWLRINQAACLPTGRLDSLIKQLGAQPHSQPLIQGDGYDIRIYNRQLFMVKPVQQTDLQSCYELNNDDVVRISPLGLEISRAEVFRRLKLVDEGQALSLCFRRYGTAPKPARHRLKRLFQKYHVPPWLRGQTPQIHIDGELTALLL